MKRREVNSKDFYDNWTTGDKNGAAVLSNVLGQINANGKAIEDGMLGERDVVQCSLRIAKEW